MLVALYPGSDYDYSNGDTIGRLSHGDSSLVDLWKTSSSIAVTVDTLTVSEAVNSFAPGSSGGCFDLRPEHLQDCLAADSGGVLLERYTHLVNY